MKRFQGRLTAAYALAVLGLLAVGIPTLYAAMDTVQTAQVKVKGRTETVLADVHGMPLYYSTMDSAKDAKCTGKCAHYWPPLLLKSGEPTGPQSIQTGLSVFDGANGRQVAYNGHPLYRFHNEKRGIANGEGVASHWYVATPNLKEGSAAQGSMSTSSSKSGW
jgi:predicted lipoprotein with Yx(FWY)xxD motif